MLILPSSLLRPDQQDIGIADAVSIAVFGRSIGQFVGYALGGVEHGYRAWVQRSDNEDMCHQYAPFSPVAPSVPVSWRNRLTVSAAAVASSRTSPETVTIL